MIRKTHKVYQLIALSVSVIDSFTAEVVDWGKPFVSDLRGLAGEGDATLASFLSSLGLIERYA